MATEPVTTADNPEVRVPLWDSQEPATITSYLPANWQKRSLDYGDYWIPSAGNTITAIERKEWGDLLNSLGSSRVNEQLFRCLSNADTVILLLEGFLTNTYDGFCKLKRGATGWRYSAVQGYLLSVQLSGVHLFLTANESETVRCLIMLEKFLQEDRHTALLHAARFVPKCSEWRSLNLLSAIEGVDIELAKRLLQQFGTPRAVFGATESELRQVQGIGPKKASSIRKVLDEMWKEVKTND